jgi:hypothetical protein
MRKLLLGVGLMLAGRYVARHTPVGWRRFGSLSALTGAIMASAANELMGKKPAPRTPDAAPPQKA